MTFAGRAAALLVVLCLLPFSQAASWTDAAGDQRLGRATHYQDGQAQYQWVEAEGQGWYQNVDLRAGAITETARDLVFRIEIGAHEPEGPPPLPGMPEFESFVHGFSFTFGGVEYHVGLFDGFFGLEGPFVAQLVKYEVIGQTMYFPRFLGEATPLADATGWTGSLPKSLFRDQLLVPLREGDVLEDVRLFASDNDFSFGGPWSYCPDAPSQPGSLDVQYCSWTVRDDTDVLGDVAVEKTPPGVGHLFLRIEEPYRLSNGLATTYLFEAMLHNLEETADDVMLQVSDIPPRWEVRLPPRVQFDGKDAVKVPIAVTVPFQHVHGANHFLTLSAVSQRNASATVSGSFGVIFADPPQPAGHHDTLWFHAEEACPPSFGFSCAFGYMNADQDPDEPMFHDGRFVDEIEADHAFYDFRDPENAAKPAHRTWWFELQPSLGIGLDFDVAKKGHLEATLRFEDEWSADLHAELLLYDWDGPATLLASGDLQAEFVADQAQTVQIELTPTAASDRVPFAWGQNLVLTLNATDASGLPWFARQTAAVALVPEMAMRLPLLDYHDDVDLTGLQVADLRIEQLNRTFKAVNPGNTTVFGFNVTNLSQRQVALDWGVVGEEHYVKWARVSPGTTHLAPGGNGTVVVRVTAPPDAEEGDVAELLLVGTARHDKDMQVFGRLVAAVDDKRAIPDESGAADDLEEQAAKENRANQKKSPLAAPALALLVAVALRRRR